MLQRLRQVAILVLRIIRLQSGNSTNQQSIRTPVDSWQLDIQDISSIPTLQAIFTTYPFLSLSLYIYIIYILLCFHSFFPQVSLALHSKSISTLEGEWWRGKSSLYFLVCPPCQQCIQCRKKQHGLGILGLPSQHLQLAHSTGVSCMSPCKDE